MNYAQWLIFALGVVCGRIWHLAARRAIKRSDLDFWNGYKPSNPITPAEVTRAIDAAHAVSVEVALMELGAEGFDGRERRLGAEVDGMMGIERGRVA
jgi:hypothetical protein